MGWGWVAWGGGDGVWIEQRVDVESSPSTPPGPLSPSGRVWGRGQRGGIPKREIPPERVLTVDLGLDQNNRGRIRGKQRALTEQREISGGWMRCGA